MATTSHIIWALIGFCVGMGCLWVCHMLRSRGFRYFWYHPILGGIVAVAILYILDTLMTWMSVLEMEANWYIVFFIMLPLAILAGLFFYRAMTQHRAAEKP